MQLVNLIKTELINDLLKCFFSLARVDQDKSVELHATALIPVEWQASDPWVMHYCTMDR